MRERLRTLKLMAFVALAFSLVVVAESSQAIAESFLAGEEDTMTAQVNKERAGHERPSLAKNSALRWIARRQAQRMVMAGYIYHSTSLEREADKAIPGWLSLGENVGMGPDGAAVFAAFLGSRAHHRNIDLREYTIIGLGAMADGEGTMYFTQNFARWSPKKRPRASAASSRPARRATVRRPVKRSAPSVVRVRKRAPAAAQSRPSPRATARPTAASTPSVLGAHARAEPSIEFDVIPPDPSGPGAGNERPVTFLGGMAAMLERFGRTAAGSATVTPWHVAALAMALGAAQMVRSEHRRRASVKIW